MQFKRCPGRQQTPRAFTKHHNIMKRLYWIVCVFLSLFSCEDELETSPPSKETYVSNFGISSARRYFESTAKDLSYLSFRDDRPQTRAGLSTEAELVPQWEKARFSSNDEVELVEVPLHTGADMYSTTRNVQSGEQVMAKSFPSAMRLIIARRTSGDTLMFVTTLVPTLARSPHPVKSMNNFCYLGGGDFTGKVFCSTLEGRFVEVCQYVNGHRAGLLKATTRSQLEARGVDLNTMSYESITWSPASVVLNEQYGDEGLNPGGGSGMCSFHPSYPAESCPYCIEEVIVRSCQYCGARLEVGEVCDCRCDVCGSYPCKCCFYCGTYPCICESDCEICRPLPCMVCEKCGSHFCFGTCGEEPDLGGEDQGQGNGNGQVSTGLTTSQIFDKLYEAGEPPLTAPQLQTLKNALISWMEKYPIFKEIVEKFVNSGEKVAFSINPEKIGDRGSTMYQRLECCIYYAVESSMTNMLSLEEMIHAYQYQVAYTTPPSTRNIEVEAKIFYDLMRAEADNLKDADPTSNKIRLGLHHPNAIDAYENFWNTFITNNYQLNSGWFNDYLKIGKYWNESGYEDLPPFEQVTPKLIDEFIPKK